MIEKIVCIPKRNNMVRNVSKSSVNSWRSMCVCVCGEEVGKYLISLMVAGLLTSAERPLYWFVLAFLPIYYYFYINRICNFKMVWLYYFFIWLKLLFAEITSLYGSVQNAKHYCWNNADKHHCNKWLLQWLTETKEF